MVILVTLALTFLTQEGLIGITIHHFKHKLYKILLAH